MKKYIRIAKLIQPHSNYIVGELIKIADYIVEKVDQSEYAENLEDSTWHDDG